MKAKYLLILVLLASSLPASANICHLAKFTGAKKCAEGDIFGAVTKPVTAQVAQKSIAYYCDHQASIVVLEAEDSPRRYFFSCRFHANSNAKAVAQQK